MLLSHALKIAARPKLEFGSGTVNTTTSSSYTFSNMSIGTADPNRYVIVTLWYRIAATFVADPTVTVGGQACTLVGVTGTTTNPHLRACVYITSSVFTSGTTANVVVTATTGQSFTRAFISTYAITKNSPLVTGQVAGSSAPANPQTAVSNLVSNQVGIVISGIQTGSSLTGFSVTGPVVNNYNSGVISSVAGFISSTLTFSGTVTCTTVGTSSSSRMLLVTWS